MLINTLITQILPLIGGLYLLSRIYSSIFNVNPKHELSLKELSNTIQNMAGVWWFLLPIIGAGVLIYNLSLHSIWFIAELIGWGIKAFQWIYQEVVVAGFFLITKTLWHYAIKWPWRIFTEGFSWIKPSMNLNNFKVGFMSLFSALGIVFLAKYLEMGLHWPNWITLILELVSILPLGIGAGILITTNGKSKSKIEPKEIRNRYIKHVGYLIGLFAAFILIEVFFIWAFSYSSFASTLSTIWIGGNMITSVLIILNALLLIFTISVLPSFSMDNDSDLKTFVSNYWNYIKVKGLHHFTATAGAVIPAIILCILPYYLMSGSMYVAGQLTDEVKNIRLNNTKDSAYQFDLTKLKSLNATSDSQLTVELKKHSDYVNKLSSSSNVIRNFDYLNSFYSRRGKEYAAAPVGIAMYEYGYYMIHAKAYLNSERVSQAEQIDTNAYKNEISMLNSENEDFKIVAESAKTNTTASNDSASVVVADVATSDTTSASDTTNSPTVNEQSNASQIVNDDAIQAKLQMERNKKLIAHLTELKKNSISASGTVAFSDKLAFLIYSLWLAAAIAFSLAFGFVIFVLYQRSIYAEKMGESTWYITELIQEAQSKNKNQPLMALVILFGLFYAYSHNNYNPLSWKLPFINKSIQSSVLPNTIDSVSTSELIDTLAIPENNTIQNTDAYGNPINTDMNGNPIDVVVDSTATAVPDAYIVD